MMTRRREPMQPSTKTITHILFTAGDRSHTWAVINGAIIGETLSDRFSIHQVDIATIRVDDINDRLPFNKLL
jgi:hypothetical protein